MHLASFGEKIPAQWPVLDFDTWTDDLRAICGRFNPRRRESCDRVRGGAMRFDAGGLAIAQVANDLDLIRRDSADIRVDQGDNLFLLLQLEGCCGIEQFGNQEKLHPGDCILVDGARPSIFHFGGGFSNHLSVHLPRQFLLSDGKSRPALAQKITANDPMSVMLGALLAKLLKTGPHDSRAPQMRDLLFSATRQAFALSGLVGPAAPDDASAGRLETVQILIDDNLTEDHLTPHWLAAKLGVSLRTLQDDMAAQGVTITGLIKQKRLHLARAKLEQLRGGHHPGAIADIAFAVGFNDISYFNRCFRKAYHCAPKDVLLG